MKLPKTARLTSALCLVAAAAVADTNAVSGYWDGIRPFEMKGGLKAFWNVGGRDRDANEREAVARGFGTVALLNTYSDYPGRQKEKIIPNGRNPWEKPEYFERIIRRNIEETRDGQIFVHDIEFDFEENTDILWQEPALRAASGAATPQAFRDAYYREWGSWFTLPCRWAKEKYPGTPVGIYGPQPFRRDYWGVSGKDAQQIDGTHKTDAELWRHIGPVVDFGIASIYCFYDTPGSVYYMGANVEENCLRMSASGKPVYAYLWLRYHDSNQKLKGQEVADYLAESMAVLPFFCGARGVVLWGWEPRGQGPYYRNLPLFVRSLGRVADLSEKIARAKPAPDEPIHVAWKEKRPLIRRLCVGADEWLVLVCDPWQAESEEKTVTVACGKRAVSLTIRGKHTDIYQVSSGKAARVEMAP